MRTVKLLQKIYLGSIWISIRNMLQHPFVEGGLVMSAGLGLVDFDQKIPSYASTFVAGDSDSILGAGKDSIIVESGGMHYRANNPFKSGCKIIQIQNYFDIASILPSYCRRIVREFC